MSSRNYRSGANFEREVKRLLESKKFYVVRSAGSKGAVDIVAGKNYVFYFIQCKASHRIPLHTYETLESASKLAGAIPVIAKKDKGKVEFFSLRGGKIEF